MAVAEGTDFSKRKQSLIEYLEPSRLPPKRISKWQSFKIFIYNSDTGEFLGRTALSWGKILLFYIVFYGFLAGFFAAMLEIFYLTVSTHEPRFMKDAGVIGTDPGMGFRPMSSSEVSSTLIWYERERNTSYGYWTKKLDDFMKPYEEQKFSLPYDACRSGQTYGFSQGTPCILVKLNKILEWTPDPYYSTDELPDAMPEDLKEIVRNSNSSTLENGMIWVSCAGENPADKQNIGPLMYTPEQGLPTSAYPYQNKDGYLSPIIMVQFTNPGFGILLNVECRAWAKNIGYDSVQRKGSVHFELLID